MNLNMASEDDKLKGKKVIPVNGFCGLNYFDI